MSLVDISIIIATRNREKILWETIEKARQAIKNKKVELIVVNDSDSRIIVPQKISDGIIYLDNPRKGVSSARNFGAFNAKGYILFFIDDDMWINSEVIDWINYNLIENKSEEAAYNMNWEYPPSLNEKLINSKIGKYILAHCYNTMWGRMHRKEDKPINGLYSFNIIGSCSLIMSKKVFNKIGGYNEAMIFQGEDIDLSNKLNNFSIPIYCVFDVTLYHNHQDRLEIDSFLKRNSDGFESEFNAVKLGFIEPLSDIKYRGIKKQMFNFFCLTEKGWMFLLKIIPNQSFFILINNKLIGYLESLQRYKQWKKILG
ncbi:MAG TPA: glycosyltransferase [Hanamia sp.]|nr:glycosyltransferase [Hanamia sp.]